MFSQGNPLETLGTVSEVQRTGKILSTFDCTYCQNLVRRKRAQMEFHPTEVNNCKIPLVLHDLIGDHTGKIIRPYQPSKHSHHKTHWRPWQKLERSYPSKIYLSTRRMQYTVQFSNPLKMYGNTPNVIHSCISAF